MPLYEYECKSCGKRFERIQKFADPLVEVCPTCGGPVQKLISSPAIQFKGSGWYVTDYARKGSTPGKSSGGDGADAGSSSGDVKEPAAKPAAGGAKESAGTPAAPSPASTKSS
jgi:putative FmdB family regulatory protein